MTAGQGSLSEILTGLAGDIILVNLALLIIYIPYALIWLWKPQQAAVIFGVFMVIYYLISIPLQAYYHNTGEIISAGNFQCSTLSAWAFSLKNTPVISYLLPFLLFAALGIYQIRSIIRQVNVFPKIAMNFFAVLLIISIPSGFELGLNSDFFIKNNHRINKPFHFTASSVRCAFGAHTPENDHISDTDRYWNIRGKNTYFGGDEYPLLRKTTTDMCLSPYFRETNDDIPPSVVMIIVEGLGNKFLYPMHEISFMPFLEGLKNESLYWNHFLATSPGTQNNLASVLGGLPYGDRGFSMIPIMPRHFSVINVLGFNDYYTSYVTGRHAWNQFTNKLLEANDTDSIWDASDFGDKFEPVLLDGTNWFWGYNDRDLLTFYFEKRKETKHYPRLEILQTGSMHDPWPVDNKELYGKKFLDKISTIEETETREHFEQSKKQYMSLMFTDDVLRDFFNMVSEDDHFENTIFVITGNYPMRKLTSEQPLEKYHIPFIIYSPLITEPGVIDNISSQNDIYDSFISMMGKNYGLNIPGFSASIGRTLCPAENHTVFIPFMDRENKISELVYGDYLFTADSKLFEIQKGFETTTSEDTEKLDELKSLLNALREVNAVASQSLIPDSLFFDFLDYLLLEDIIMQGGTFRREYVDIIEEMPLQQGYRYYLDASFVNPRVSLEEVFLVYEITDDEGNRLAWKNFGIPDKQNEAFSIKEVISTENLAAQNMHMRVFIWNESPVPYHFERARITIYRNK